MVVNRLENNKRIAKNTFFLYARMLMVMGVSLYTVRIVLNVLGAEDYGIYNVVGGVVTMFSFLTSTMVSASQRFFAFSIGKNDDEGLARYFTMSCWCYIGIIIFIVVIAETLGIWFVRSQLVIPLNRAYSAMWVFQLAIASFVVNLLSVPFNSIIIAHERMNVYAIVGLVEVFAKLLLTYCISNSSCDKLIVYSILMFAITFFVSFFYGLYGVWRYKECHLRMRWYPEIFKEIMNYSGWSLFGALSGVFRSQGINILLNIYFNPIVNAARAIAYQVNSAINQFVLNFFKAVQPQITKYYAASETDELYKLIYRSSRYCFFLILLLSLPIFFEMPFILNIWLKDVPQYTVLFSRLVILVAIVDSTAYPLQTATAATGRIKWYQIVTGGLLIMTLPLSWLFLKFGSEPQVTMYVALVIAIVTQILRILFANNMVGMPLKGYLKNVMRSIMMVSTLTVLLSYFIHKAFSGTSIGAFFSMVVIVFMAIAIIIIVGMTSIERQVIWDCIIKKIFKK